MNNPNKVNLKAFLSWAFYDWANSAFATTVMAGFFPIFFKEYWSSGLSVHQSTFYLGLGSSIASLLLAVSAPLIGAAADCGHRKKKFLGFCVFAGVSTTATFYLIPQGAYVLAIALYSLALLAFSSANVFYDSLIVDVSEPEKYDVVSAWGFGLGYLGGGILLALNALMTLKPEAFGLSAPSHAVRISFLSVALWWGLFAIPLFLFVRERSPHKSHLNVRQSFRSGWREIKSTLQHLRQYKTLLTFLIAYLFYIDGVNTIIKMAVDYGLSIGFGQEVLITSLLLVQFIGFPAAIVFGYLGQKFGAKPGIYVCLAVYSLVTVYAYSIQSPKEFYILAVAVALVQGGVQSLSRSYYASLVPPDRATEFFGFFNMLGKFAAILGPIMVGFVSLNTGSPRLSILVILVFFAIGAAILAKTQREPALD